MQIKGYNHRGLDVDLSTGEIRVFEIDPEVIEQFIGGRGLGVFYLTQGLDPLVDPLSEKNRLVFSTGALGGSLTPSNARFSVSFKSPLTNTISSANSGGSWGGALKNSGFDVAVIRGKANAPVYLNISDGLADFIECPNFWGMSMPELDAAMAEKHGKKAKVLGIGPAGENRVLISSIISDSGHALGRGGAGAVMGSKNLKALVVSGRKNFDPANPSLYEAGVHQASKLIRNMPITSKALPELGTAGLVNLIADHDMLPHENFRDVSHNPDDLIGVSGETLRRKILTTKKACPHCTIACIRRTKVKSKSGEGPEYETIGMMGPNLGIYDIEEIALANYVCNDTGLDTISFGNTVGAAMEMYEAGIINTTHTGGLDLKFGAKGILEKLAIDTAHARGFGREIGLGAKRLTEKFGAPHLAMAVKGLELPAYDPRSSLLQALGYATSPRGGCHLKGGYAINLGFFGGSRQVDRFLVDTVAGHIVNLQDSGCVGDMLGVCRFAFFSVSENELSRIYSGFTGLNRSPEDLKQAAKRVQNRERKFNVQAGFKREDDTLPERFFTEEIMVDGQMRIVDRDAHLGHMLNKYYDIRNWNQEGVPPEVE